MNKIRILGFAGSLRRDSFNKALLRAAAESLPASAELEIFDLQGIPLFNQDFENDPPAIVRDFKLKIRAADAILIATPEYDYSFPGVLKNAIDWASRPYGDNSFDDKPVAIISASAGMLGGVRAQYQLRQVLVYLNMHPVNTPDVLIGFEVQKFDANGKLVDENSKKFLKQLLDNLVAWTNRLKGEPQKVAVTAS
jgi:chromate reductase, NAD(P)H dehydrogenase (quinone)